MIGSRWLEILEPAIVVGLYFVVIFSCTFHLVEGRRAKKLICATLVALAYIFLWGYMLFF